MDGLPRVTQRAACHAEQRIIPEGLLPRRQTLEKTPLLLAERNDMRAADRGRVIINTHLVRPVLLCTSIEHKFVDNYTRLRIWRKIRAQQAQLGWRIRRIQ